MKRTPFIVIVLFLSIPILYYKYFIEDLPSENYEVGQAIDSLNRVMVFYNGGIRNNDGVSKNEEGYQYGSKYESKEFVLRYYYEFYNHKMKILKEDPLDFFNPKLKDGHWNINAQLTQYTNPSKSKPQVGDLLIMEGTILDINGHVAIISNVTKNKIEIIQQNPGPRTQSRITYKLRQLKNGQWKIKHKTLLGWLRK